MVCHVVKRVIFALTYDTFYRISKVQDDEKQRVKYAHKACDKLYSSCYFVVSSLWGWYVL